MTMRRINYYMAAKQEYLERTTAVGNALTISVAIALCFILAFVVWLELELELLSNFWNSFIR